MKSRIENLYPFYLDLKIISLARIILGIILLFDLSHKIANYDFYYSDLGILSRENFFINGQNKGYFSFLLSFDSLIVRYLFLGTVVITAFTFTIGYKTRISSFLCWLILLSFHNRNIYINQGGDDLLRMILFFGIFIPWNAYYSIDTVLTDRPVARIYYEMPAFGLLAQIVIMYVMSGLLKTGEEWKTNGTALSHVFQLEQLTRDFGKWLIDYPGLLKFATHSIVILEKFAFLIFLIPIRFCVLRNTGIILLMGFHFMTFLTMRIGIFPWVSMAILFGLIVYKGENKTTFDFKFGRDLKKMLRNTFLILVIAITMVFQLRFVSAISPQNSFVNEVLYTLRLDHYWGMFAPNVYKNDGWFIMDAKTQNGQSIDLLTGKPTSKFKPDLYKFYKNDRYRKLLENIYTGNYILRRKWIDYLTNIFNSSHNDKITHVNLIYMLDLKGQDTNLPHIIKEENLYETDIN